MGAADRRQKQHDTETVHGPAPIELFSTPSGIRTVGSPVRVAILSVLSTRELSFDEIVRLSGRAKSTVSVHLKGLESEGIIGSRTDPADSRKKIFFLRSAPLGTLSARDGLRDEGAAAAGRLADEGDPFAFYRYMFRTIRVSLLAEGIHIDPVLHSAGYRVGCELAREVGGGNLETVLENLKTFWSGHNLGTIEVESTEPLVIRVRDCFECGELPELGRPACAFDAGVLRAVFSRHFGADQEVTETACYAMGNDHCRFVIVPK
jgi:predicted hydrocarbon binding protein